MTQGDTLSKSTTRTALPECLETRKPPQFSFFLVEAILAATRENFAADGLDRTTIRAVAVAAGTDPAMVMRYYGNKEGLFAAAVDVDLQLPAPVDPALWGVTLGRHFAKLWEGSEADGTLQILLRSAAGSTDVAERIRKIFDEQVTARSRSSGTR